ncbi:SUMF1/EgtB/PvdO family nonheme iron enzyme [uncultured Mesotoga sp.]|nr:SUMF1/EgtB/PvdO family nonheme iron enzyme [uncultured Mesotoga sp.]
MTQEVGTKAPNDLGIYDMSGNVYEWRSDWK